MRDKQAARQELEHALKLKSDLEGAGEAQRTLAVCRVSAALERINDKRAGSLRPFPCFALGRKQLRAEPPAQSLKTSENAAQQHERHTTVGNRVRLHSYRGRATGPAVIKDDEIT